MISSIPELSKFWNLWYFACFLYCNSVCPLQFACLSLPQKCYLKADRHGIVEGMYHSGWGKEQLVLKPKKVSNQVLYTSKVQLSTNHFVVLIM